MSNLGSVARLQGFRLNVDSLNDLGRKGFGLTVPDSVFHYGMKVPHKDLKMMLVIISAPIFCSSIQACAFRIEGLSAEGLRVLVAHGHGIKNLQLHAAYWVVVQNKERP